jgi:uncharacterized protein YceH (UPF0502 family)
MMEDEAMSSADNSSGHDSEHIALDPVEIRVLAVMAEKEALTPDNYPLSLNGLTNGCNQLSSRDPIMTLSETEVQEALDRLIGRKLAAEVRQAGARVVKFEHRMRIQWILEQDKLAVLSVLMLRGPQTAAEIRGRTGRMHDFATVFDAENALQFLIDKYPPLAVKLPRVPGTKEVRYMHTFSGFEPEEAQAATAQSRTGAGSSSNQDRVAKLETEVESLRSELQQLKAEFAEFRKQFD